MTQLCSLQLDVYFPPSLDPLIDETVVDWSVSTDPAHAFPYLLSPRQYAAQEIDPIKCSATIGQVEIGVIDAYIDPDDQTTGWMTAKVYDLLGRRCRLRRYVGGTIGWVVIADGPAGTPKMDQSYSAYRWTIRDTRDTERKTEAFTSGGVSAVMPQGPMDDWGNYTDGGGSHVLLPSVLDTPLTGFMAVSPGVGIVRLSGHVVSGVLNDPRLVVNDAMVAAMATTQIDDNSFVALHADVLWRKAGDTAWNVSRPRGTVAYPVPFATYTDVVLNIDDSSTVRALAYVTLYVEPGSTSPPAGFPADGDTVEFVIRYLGPASEDFPYYLEDDLGTVLMNLYNGVYQNTVDVGVTGFHYDPAGLNDLTTPVTPIRFDASAFAPMNEKVLLRQTSPITDVRNFAESQLYQPSGWIPALDNDEQISPVSRTRPVTIDSSLLITNAHVVPSPSWLTGDRVVSSVQYNYDRYFVPDDSAGFTTTPDGLATRAISILYEDEDSRKRYGEYGETFDASAFSAIGTGTGLNLAGQTEQASLLAQLARFDLVDRFRAGVQVITVQVLRSRIPDVRTGDWIPWDLSWTPNRSTGLRGGPVDAAQIVSILDDNCTWRTLTLEESGSAGSIANQPGYYSDLTIDLDDLDPGYYSDVIEDSDDPSE